MENLWVESQIQPQKVPMRKALGERHDFKKGLIYVRSANATCHDGGKSKREW
jgi:hypothetical protein